MRDNKLKPIEDLLSQEESTTLDFKRQIGFSSDKDKHEFAKDISALANTQGGAIVYGKEDKREGGKIVGILPETFEPDQMHQIISQRCDPPPAFEARIVKSGEKYFVVLEVPESKLKPHEVVQNREVWVRRGATSDKATQKEREEMARRRNKSTLDERLETEGIPVEAENLLRRIIIKYGRQYVLKTYGKLDTQIKKEKITLVGIGSACLIPLFVTMFIIMQSHQVPPQWVLSASILLPILGIFLFGLVEATAKLQCPACNRQFAVRRKKRTRAHSEVLHKTKDEIVREITYHNVYACDFCKYRKERFEPVTERISLE